MKLAMKMISGLNLIRVVAVASLLGAAVLLVAYQFCMRIATITWPTRAFSPDVWRELSSWVSIRFGGTALIFIAVIAADSVSSGKHPFLRRMYVVFCD